MKKLFFFKSSSGNGNDKQARRGKESEATPKGGGAIKSQSGQALRRSHSFSSAAFLVDGTSSNDPNATRQRNHSSRYVLFFYFLSHSFFVELFVNCNVQEIVRPINVYKIFIEKSFSLVH